MKNTLLVVAVTCLPSVASAEVMDKEPSVAVLWGRALALGFLGLLAWRGHWALGAAASAVALLVVGSFHWELSDPYVGPAIRAEAGRAYILQAYASMLICAALQAAGLALYVRRRPHGGVGGLRE